MVMPDENSSVRTRQPQPSSPVSPSTVPGVHVMQSAPQPGTPGKPANHPSPTPVAPPPHNDSDESHSIGALLMIGGGLLVALIVAIFLIVFIVSRFTGGGNKTVTLEYWGLWEDSNVMQSVISDFERENPTIKVDYVKQDPKEYTDRLLNRIQNGTGPDIFRFHNTWMPMLVSVLSPLPQTTMTAQEFANTYYSVAQQDLVHNGAIYGVPLEIDTLALFTNDQLLKKENVSIPEKWDDFITDARALTVKDPKGQIKVGGAAMGTYDNVTHAPDIISLLLAQNGANPEDLSSTSKNATDALAFYTNFVKEDGNVWDDTLDPSFIAFAKGDLGMYFGFSWDVLNLKLYNPSLQFTVSPVPHLPGRNITIASYWVEGVSAKSQHQKEAMLFMKFLAQKDTQQKLYTEEAKTRLFGEPFSRKDLANTVKDNQLLWPFINQANQAVSSIFASSTQNTGFSEQLNQYLQRTIGDVLQDTSPDTAVTTLAQGVSQVLSQYGSTQTSGN